MLILAIEQSTPEAGIALLRDDETLALHEWREERKRDQNLFGALPAVLKEGGIDVADLDRFAVGLGPGSFSGIRIAIAAVSAMALPDRTPLCGVSSAAALAYHMMQERRASCVAVIGDARRDRLWVAVYGKTAERPSPHAIRTLSLLPVEALHEHLPSACCVVTSEWERLKQVLEPLASGEIDVVTRSAVPRVLDVARLASQQPASALTSPLDPPQPLYLHPAVFVAPRIPAQERRA